MLMEEGGGNCSCWPLSHFPLGQAAFSRRLSLAYEARAWEGERQEGSAAVILRKNVNCHSPWDRKVIRVESEFYKG